MFTKVEAEGDSYGARVVRIQVDVVMPYLVFLKGTFSNNDVKTTIKNLAA